MSLPPAPGTDLFALAARLVDVPSVSHHEDEMADVVESLLTGLGGGVLEVARIGNNVCARTRLGLAHRLVLAGHLDTVPANGNEHARREGDVLFGLGAADMKGGDAVLLEAARAVAAAGSAGELSGVLAADLTWIFYTCEEVDRRHSGLLEIAERDPGWLEADAAVLAEPTGAVVEAGCQGVLRVVVETVGERAHTARAWMGRNAIHALAPVLTAAAAYEGRRPVIDGCEYREALQAVSIGGGVANNVVPDRARLTLNHRFAPDRTVEEAFEAVRSLVAASLGDDAEHALVELDDSAAAAVPGLGHPLLASLVRATSAPPRAKLGWTDVSFFSSRGVPAANFGPGEPTVAHTAGERVHRDQLERAFAAVCSVIAR